MADCYAINLGTLISGNILLLSLVQAMPTSPMFVTLVSYTKRFSQIFEADPSLYTITHKTFEINYTGKEEVQLPLIDGDFISQLILVVTQIH